MHPMNRKQRRRAAAQSRKQPAVGPTRLFVPDELKPGIGWEQMIDPDDAEYILIEARIPKGGMQPGSWADKEAFMRMFEFCSGFMKAFTK